MRIRPFRLLPIAALAVAAACTSAPQTQTYVIPGPSGPFNPVQPTQLTPIVVAPSPAPARPSTTTRPSDGQVGRFATGVLNGIQARSIRERREYCGLILVDGTGQLKATPPRPGTFAGCETLLPARLDNIVASYHTHGAFSPAYDNEVPSTIDLQSDFSLGIDGYVSTPGGRIWHTDFQTRTTRQLCGLGCVTSDPGFQPVGESRIRQSYTLPDLQRRAAGF